MVTTDINLRFLNVLRCCCPPTKAHTSISQWIIFGKIFRANLTTDTYSRKFSVGVSQPFSKRLQIPPTSVEEAAVMLCQSCMVINVTSIFRDLYSSLVRSLCKIKIKIIYIYKDSRGLKLYIYPADLTVIGKN